MRSGADESINSIAGLTGANVVSIAEDHNGVGGTVAK